MPWDATRVVSAVRKEAQDQIERVAERILNSANNIVPLNKDEDLAWHRGTLQRSGEVTNAKTDFSRELGSGMAGGAMTAMGEVAVATVRYSVDEDFDYALLQHDNLEFDHEAGRQALYLEQPFNEMKDAAIANVQRAVNSMLRRMP